MDARTIAGFGRQVHSRIRTFFDTPIGSDASPLEIVQAALDALEQQVQPVGRGRRVFPFVGIVLHVLVTESSSAAVRAACADLRSRALERLAELRCDTPNPLDVDVVCVSVPPDGWSVGQVFAIEYIAAESPAPSQETAAAGAPLPVLSVTVMAGTTETTPEAFTEATISIGRTSGPSDDQGRLRRNRIAFLDIVDGINETVGRAHARLRRDPVSAEYRLFDEGSRNGTSILRDGEMIVVHRRDPRGVRVRSGDQIHLGRAILRVEIQ